MSSMWNVSVINKGEKWIDLEVVLAHPDAGSFAEDPVFALELLTSEAYGFDDNYNRVATSPLSESINFDDSYLPSSLSPRVDEFIEKVVIYEAHNIPFDESDAHAKVDEQVLALGVDRDDDEWDGHWDDFWRDFWHSKENLPWARYRIWVTDEKWIEHMELGQEFDTASYSEYGPWIDEDRMISLEDEGDSAARKGVEGFHQSEIPPGNNMMDTELIRSMAENSDAISKEEIDEKLAEHAKFLASGGANGSFMRLEVAGIPLNIYQGAGSEGSQLEIRMKKFEPGTSLAGKDLSYADLSGALCEHVDFSGANLDGAILTDGFFANASFEGASMRNIDFSGADFTNASFKNANLQDGDFEIVNCSNADFTGANIKGATFKGANLTGIKR